LSDKEILQIIKKLESEYNQEEDGNKLDTSSIINMSLRENSRSSTINGKNSSIINIPLKDTFNSESSTVLEQLTSGKSHVNK